MDFNIEESYNDTRVDKYLRKKLHDKPLGEIFKLFRKGNVKINGKNSGNYSFTIDKRIT